MSASSRTEIFRPEVTDPRGGESVLARTLTQLATTAPGLDGIWKHDTRPGDWVIVRTKNSTYTFGVEADQSLVVSGGWFAGADAGACRVRVSGCTWGGSAILTGMLAAPGMCVEFSNGVRTTRVRDVQLVRDVAGRPH